MNIVLSSLCQFFHSRRASTTVIMATMLPVVLTVTLFTIEYSNIMYYRMSVQRSLDSSLIAGVMYANNNTSDGPEKKNTRGDTKPQNKIRMINAETANVFHANIVEINKLIKVKNLRVVEQSANQYKATVDLELKPMIVSRFTKLNLFEKISLSSTVASAMPAAEIAISFDVATMFNTYSTDDYLASVKNAVNTIVDTVYEVNNENDDLRISLIPFADGIKTSPHVSNTWLAHPFDSEDVGTLFKGCVTSRAVAEPRAPYNTNDAPPTTPANKLPVFQGPFILSDVYNAWSIANTPRYPYFFWVYKMPPGAGYMGDIIHRFFQTYIPWQTYHGHIRTVRQAKAYAPFLYMEHPNSPSSAIQPQAPGIFHFFGDGSINVDAQGTMASGYDWQPVRISSELSWHESGSIDFGKYASAIQAHIGVNDGIIASVTGGAPFGKYKDIKQKIFYSAFSSDTGMLPAPGSVPPLAEMTVSEYVTGSTHVGKKFDLQDNVLFNSTTDPVYYPTFYHDYLRFITRKYTGTHLRVHSPMNVYGMQYIVGCEIPEAAFFMRNKSEMSGIINAIDYNSLDGSSRTSVGIAWAYYALSPKWRGVLPEYSTKTVTDSYPKDYSKEKKIALLVTANPTLAKFDYEVMKRTCTAMKNDGIDIVIVNFFNGNNPAHQGSLQSCVKKPEYYLFKPSEEQIKTTLKSLLNEGQATGSTTNKLRLIE